MEIEVSFSISGAAAICLFRPDNFQRRKIWGGHAQYPHTPGWQHPPPYRTAVNCPSIQNCRNRVCRSGVYAVAPWHTLGTLRTKFVKLFGPCCSAWKILDCSKQLNSFSLLCRPSGRSVGRARHS